MDSKELNDVMFTKVVCDGKRFKVVEVGNDAGKIPESKCWWLHRNNARLAEIEKIQSFAKMLNPLEYPSIDDILSVQNILNNWLTVSGNFAN